MKTDKELIEEFDEKFPEEMWDMTSAQRAELFAIKQFWLSQRKADMEQLKFRIGLLRQWLNEDRITDTDKLVTNEMIEHWLLDTITSNKE